jgi:ectoine hydroxylase-related dioxygenase (phytanoyl-CoA dioxygenase family)
MAVGTGLMGEARQLGGRFNMTPNDPIKGKYEGMFPRILKQILKTDDIAAYQQDGAVCLRGIFDQHWIDLLRAGVERNLREPGRYAKRYTPEGQPGMFFGDYCNWDRIPEYRRFFFESPAKEAAAELMGASKVNLYHEHILVKEPGTREKTPWHHDQPYYPVDGDHIVSLWIPLDPVSRATTVEFLAGSHRWGKWFQPKRFADAKTHQNVAERFESSPDVDSARDQYEILGWALEPGDCLAFHGLTLHGAPGNATQSRRRAFSARFTGDDARFVLRDGFMSPPPPESGGPLVGAPMDSAVFPVILRRD